MMGIRGQVIVKVQIMTFIILPSFFWLIYEKWGIGFDVVKLLTVQ
jgi:hypothetical protein